MKTDESNKSKVLIVSSNHKLDGTSEIWGTGGWQPPDKREDIDWITFVYLLGWAAIIVSPDNLNANLLNNGCFKWIIFACPMETIDDVTFKILKERAKEDSIMILFRQTTYDKGLSETTKSMIINKRKSSFNIQWQGPGKKRSWKCLNSFSIFPLKLDVNDDIWAKIDHFPLIKARKIGERSHFVYLGFHPSEARDSEGSITALLKHLFIFGIEKPVAWIDWVGSMLLRMDDPGSSQTVHHNTYKDVNKLNLRQWDSIRQILKKYHACLTIGYVSGWVDDGNKERGFLSVDNVNVTRVPGSVFPSPVVKYIRKLGSQEKLYDYQDEYSGIFNLVKEGLIDIAVHGYTHIFPDFKKWLAASNCYEAENWYSEFSTDGMDYINTEVKNGRPHPLEKAVDLIIKFFNTRPTTLINPREKFTNTILKKALDLNFKLISSYYMAIRIENKFCWTQHICSPYLDKADPSWFKSELPVVGYFHDFDISRFGSRWLDNNLHAWKKAGAFNFYDFNTLSTILDSSIDLIRENNQYVLQINTERQLEFKNPVRIYFKFTSSEKINQIKVRNLTQEKYAKFYMLTEKIGFILLRNTFPQ